MNKIYDIFEFMLPKKTKKYVKKHKIRNIGLSFNKDDYNQMLYQLQKLKITNSNDLETISKLEFKLKDMEEKYNITNIEKIDYLLTSLEKYYEQTKEETNNFPKRRGLYIYEDLSYKLIKLRKSQPLNTEKIAKMEQKLKECQTKYSLNELEQIDAKINALEKYEELIFNQEKNKSIGLDTYKNLLNELKKLKQENSKNNEKINNLETQIKRCSNQYALSNLDKINIQLNILEENI